MSVRVSSLSGSAWELGVLTRSAASDAESRSAASDFGRTLDWTPSSSRGNGTSACSLLDGFRRLCRQLFAAGHAVGGSCSCSCSCGFLR